MWLQRTTMLRSLPISGMRHVVGFGAKSGVKHPRRRGWNFFLSRYDEELCIGGNVHCTGNFGIGFGPIRRCNVRHRRMCALILSKIDMFGRSEGRRFILKIIGSFGRTPILPPGPIVFGALLIAPRRMQLSFAHRAACNCHQRT